MRQAWWTVVLVTFVSALGVGCTKTDGGGGEKTDAGKTADGDAPKTAPVATDPAIVALDAFIAKHTAEADERGRKIDKSNPNWRAMLPKPPLLEFTPGKSYMLSMKTNHGPVKIKLRPDLAPMHVSNAIYLSRVGFYDGNKSHRAVKRFMAQAGSMDGRGGGNLGYALNLEADQRHVYDRKGLLAAARTGDPNSAGSQFFLMYAPYPGLNISPRNQGYTIYGELAEDKKAESEATLAAMEKVSNPGDGPPLGPIEFESFSITVE